MFDITSIMAIAESDSAKPLINKFMAAFTDNYRDEQSDLGTATREIVTALSDDKHPLFGDMPVMARKVVNMWAKDFNRKLTKE